jgi:glucose-6-phosphate isomerase
MTIQQWDRFKGLYFESRAHGFALDISRMNFPNEFPGQHLDSMRLALEDMIKLEGGAIANRDEKRMVGHYWLRDFKRAPNNEIRSQISNALLNVKKFTELIHAGKVCAPDEKPFRHLLVIGIGGSALGPEFINHALGTCADPLNAFFFDNTAPDGMSKVLGAIPDLGSTFAS